MLLTEINILIKVNRLINIIFYVFPERSLQGPQVYAPLLEYY